MHKDRLNDLSRWRDAQLVKRHGDEAAAYRLREYGLGKAKEIEAPTAEELQWTDLKGEPINPDHSWWGYEGLSEVEKTARSLGKWPPPD